jgi:hypothetical protein
MQSQDWHLKYFIEYIKVLGVERSTLTISPRVIRAALPERKPSSVYTEIDIFPHWEKIAKRFVSDFDYFDVNRVLLSSPTTVAIAFGV